MSQKGRVGVGGGRASKRVEHVLESHLKAGETQRQSETFGMETET